MYLSSTEMQPARPRTDRDKAYFKRLLKLTPEFQLSNRSCDRRQVAQSYIRDRFKECYGANLREFLSYLVSMRCLGSLSGVAGLSLAAQQTLFLEQYLDSPIEKELERVLQVNVSRNSIVEVGNLVATTRGASLALFIVVATALSRAGFKYIVFTATSPLRITFEKLGFKTGFLKDANIDSVDSDSDNDWGSYYDSNPQVVVGRLEDALQVIANRNLFYCLQSVFSGEIDLLVRQLQVQASGA